MPEMMRRAMPWLAAAGALLWAYSALVVALQPVSPVNALVVLACSLLLSWRGPVPQ